MCYLLAYNIGCCMLRGGGRVEEVPIIVRCGVEELRNIGSQGTCARTLLQGLRLPISRSFR